MYACTEAKQIGFILTREAVATLSLTARQTKIDHIHLITEDKSPMISRVLAVDVLTSAVVAY